MSLSYLSERQRCEIAIPARLLFGLAVCDVFSDPDNADLKRIKSLLMSACIEPLVGLDERAGGKVARRIERITRSVAGEFDDQPGVKVALSLYYFVKELIDRGILVLWEGSDVGEAINLLVPMFEHGFEVEKQDLSAQKQARKLLDRLQREGYYQ
jgi:hypothetical protein